jgi:hypothetical protein
MCLVAWLSRSISSAEEDVLAGTSPTWRAGGDRGC